MFVKLVLSICVVGTFGYIIRKDTANPPLQSHDLDPGNPTLQSYDLYPGNPPLKSYDFDPSNPPLKSYDFDPSKPPLKLYDFDPINPPLKLYDFDPGNLPLKRLGCGPDSRPQQWQDLASFVYRKIEDMEQLLTEKDERIDKLELNIKQLKRGMTSLEQLVLEKDEAVNTLVMRISDLVRVVVFDTISNERESQQSVRSQFTTSDNDTQLGLGEISDSKSGSYVKKESNKQLSILETSKNDNITPTRSEQRIKNDDNLLQSQADEDDTVVYNEKVSRDLSITKFSRFQQKRVAPSLPSYKTTIAFHVAISANQAVTNDDVVVYDHETLDQGSGYNTGDGIYIVPESGTYVLTWTTICNPHNQFQAVLVVNGVARGSSFADSKEITDFHQTTAIVVLTLNQGDHVFIRMGHTYGHGIIISQSNLGKSTFSGWKLD